MRNTFLFTVILTIFIISCIPSSDNKIKVIIDDLSGTLDIPGLSRENHVFKDLKIVFVEKDESVDFKSIEIFPDEMIDYKVYLEKDKLTLTEDVKKEIISIIEKQRHHGAEKLSINLNTKECCITQ